MKKKCLMKLVSDKEGRFIKRINRFLGEVQINRSKHILVHLHDSGRLKEILTGQI